jgi:hypothetical protein
MLMIGCSGSDAKMRRQIIGSWTARSGSAGSFIFMADGSFRAKFSSDSPQWMQEQDGTWDVKDGFLNMTVTNSTSLNQPIVLPVGHVSHCKVMFIDAHTFTYKNTDGSETFTQTR